MAENNKDYAALKTEVQEMLTRCKEQAELNQSLISAQALINLGYDMEDMAGKIFGAADDMLENARLHNTALLLMEGVGEDAFSADELDDLLLWENEVLATMPDYGYMLEEDDDLDDGEQPAGGEAPEDEE